MDGSSTVEFKYGKIRIYIQKQIQIYMYFKNKIEIKKYI